jgi:hypothetical protein
MASDYAFIRAYGKFIDARESSVDDEVRRARRENAPNDVFRFDIEEKRWKLFTELEEQAAGGDGVAADTVKTVRALMR